MKVEVEVFFHAAFVFRVLSDHSLRASYWLAVPAASFLSGPVFMPFSPLARRGHPYKAAKCST
jgi:hypothetical protein